MVLPQFNKNAAIHSLIKKTLNSYHIRITRRAEVSSEEINSKKLFEAQFESVWSWATVNRITALRPDKWEQRAFEKFFNVSYDFALSSRLIYNAVSARRGLEIFCEELSRRWSNSKVFRLRKGVYFARIPMTVTQADSKNAVVDDGESFSNAVLVVNGFALKLREDFLASGATVSVFSLEWDVSAQKSSSGMTGPDWPSFLSNVIGNQDPLMARSLSIRGRAFGDWKELGLQHCADMTDCVVYTSKSSIQALSDRLRWFSGAMLFTDPLGAIMIRERFRVQDIEEWVKDPEVEATSELRDRAATLGGASRSRATIIITADSGANNIRDFQRRQAGTAPLSQLKSAFNNSSNSNDKDSTLRHMSELLKRVEAETSVTASGKIRSSRHFVAPKEEESDEEHDDHEVPLLPIGGVINAGNERMPLFQLVKGCGLEACIEVLRELT
jgi:hypothetical protein